MTRSFTGGVRSDSFFGGSIDAIGSGSASAPHSPSRSLLTGGGLLMSGLPTLQPQQSFDVAVGRSPRTSGAGTVPLGKVEVLIRDRGEADRSKVTVVH